MSALLITLAVVNAALHISAGELDWGWTDWLGVVLVLLAMAFLLAVIVALWRKEPALKVLDRISQILTAGIRPKSK